MNVFDRFISLFTDPASSFQGLDQEPLSSGNIVLALTIVILITGGMTFLVMSTPSIQDEIFQQQKDRFEEMVEKGQLTQTQAEQQYEGAQRFMDSPFGMAISVASSVIGLILFFFVFALYFMLIAKFFGNVEEFKYSSALSVIAVLFLFSALTAILHNTLMLTTGSLYSNVGPVLLISDYDNSNIVHKLIQKVDFFLYIYLFFMAVGFKHAAKTSTMVASLAVIVPYLIISLGSLAF